MMQTDFKAIVQSEYGAPEKALKIAKRQLKSDKLGADEALVKVITRPIHVGDVHILEALPQGGPVAPIPEGTLRTPGFEGVGTIVLLGTASARLSDLEQERTRRRGFLKVSASHSFPPMVHGRNM